ncbi:hypothetical protein V8C43DRAFT_283860 [Trichoderma afarasin]
MALCTATPWYLCVLDFLIHLGFQSLHFPLYCHSFTLSLVSSSFCLEHFGLTLRHNLTYIGATNLRMACALKLW